MRVRAAGSPERSRASRAAVVSLLALTLACESTGVEGTAQRGGDEAGPAAIEPSQPGSECVDLDRAACERTAGCALLWGWDPSAYCAGGVGDTTRRTAGCHRSGEACAEEETCARRADGAEMLVFPNRCLPPDWDRLPIGSCCPPG